MGEGNGVASVIMLTFTKMPGPHAVGQLAQLKLWLACSRELMSCVGRLCNVRVVATETKAEANLIYISETDV